MPKYEKPAGGIKQSDLPKAGMPNSANGSMNYNEKMNSFDSKDAGKVNKGYKDSRYK